MEELGALAAEAEALSLAIFMVCAVSLLYQGHKLIASSFRLKHTDCKEYLPRAAKQLQNLHLNLQVTDAGRTQVAPGSVTVLAVGGVSELVDQVSRKLKLY